MKKMNFFTRNRWFQKAAIAIGVIYFGVMILVLIIGLLRHSGSTGIDVTTMIQLRAKS